MAHEVVYRCGRDNCLAEARIKFVLTRVAPESPAEWIEVRQGDYGTKFVFCSWVCTDAYVNEAAKAENVALAEEKSTPH